MASYTDYYDLLKKDPVTDGADTFNIDTMLNDNWDKIDGAMHGLDTGKEALLKNVATKTTPVNADSLPLVDSADGSATKRITWSAVKTALGKLFVPLTRTVNGKALSANITLSAEDVDADPSGSAATVQAALGTHTGNGTVHITAAERTTWNGKQAKLTFDTAPKDGSGNPVTSGGLFTALSDKAAKSVQETVEATGTGTVEVTLTASELQAYLDSLPRLVTRWYAITVTGTTEDVIVLRHFYGSGVIRIVGSSGSAVGGFNVQQCHVSIQIWYMDIQPQAGSTNACVFGAFSKFIQLTTCRLLGNGLGRGVSLENGTEAALESCGISNCDIAVFACLSSVVSVANESADVSGVHDNQTGCYVWRGGVIMLGGSTPQLLGGTSNAKQGGIIVKANGTLL